MKEIKEEKFQFWENIFELTILLFFFIVVVSGHFFQNKVGKRHSFIKQSSLERHLAVIEPQIRKNEKLLVFWTINHAKRISNRRRVISKRKAEKIVQASIRTSYPLLTLALIEVESKFDPYALNEEGETVGLGQIKSCWYQDLKQVGIVKDSFRELFKIDKNIEALNFILESCFGKGWNLRECLRRYTESDQKTIKTLANLGELYFLCYRSKRLK